LAHGVHADDELFELSLDWWESDWVIFSFLWSKGFTSTNLFNLQGSLLFFMGSFLKFLPLYFRSVIVKIINGLGVTGN
jgi:hypothetical protein